jgi:hypothetical protein
VTHLIRVCRPLGKRATPLTNVRLSSKNNVRHASMNVHRASSPNINIRCVRPAPHLANFCHSCTLGLRRRKHPEHAAAYGVHPRRRSIASPSTSTTSPGACHRLRPWSTPSTSTASPGARHHLRPRSTPSTSPASPMPQPVKSEALYQRLKWGNNHVNICV